MRTALSGNDITRKAQYYSLSIYIVVYGSDTLYSGQIGLWWTAQIISVTGVTASVSAFRAWVDFHGLVTASGGR